MLLRNFVYGALLGDPEMEQLGITSESLYVNWSPDSPAAVSPRWAVVRWGVEERSVGRETTARPLQLEVWAYDRERDYTGIDAILRRCLTIFIGLEGMRYAADGAVIAFEHASTSADLFDEAYDAATKGSTFRLIASGH